MEYAIVISAAVRERFLAFQQQAAEASVGDRLLAAIHSSTARLRTNPQDFGEMLYHLPGTNWPVHLAVVAPLAVVFTIHEAGRQVWVVNAHTLFDLGP